MRRRVRRARRCVAAILLGCALWVVAAEGMKHTRARLRVRLRAHAPVFPPPEIFRQHGSKYDGIILESIYERIARADASGGNLTQDYFKSSMQFDSRRENKASDITNQVYDLGRKSREEILVGRDRGEVIEDRITDDEELDWRSSLKKMPDTLGDHRIHRNHVEIENVLNRSVSAAGQAQAGGDGDVDLEVTDVNWFDMA